MAKNYSYAGKTVDYKNLGSDTIYSGSVVVMGTMIGVAASDIAPGKVGTVHVAEVWKLPKANTSAFTLGDAAFWDTAGKLVVAAAGDGIVPAGTVFSDAVASAATVSVKLNS